MWPFQGCPPTLESEYTVTSLWMCWLLGRKMVGYYCYVPRDFAPTTAYAAYNVFTIFMRCWIIRCIVSSNCNILWFVYTVGYRWNLHVCESVWPCVCVWGPPLLFCLQSKEPDCFGSQRECSKIPSCVSVHLYLYLFVCHFVCVCACVRAFVRAYVHACVCVLFECTECLGTCTHRLYMQYVR